ncbi:MAG TPA: DUF3142 domain-containing protein [Pseudomonas sp.]|nr:DUF3142 domain-containing protein [Pseudomonas sp.]
MIFLLALLGLGACTPPQPLDQQLYIWQRQWRPAHAEALAQSHDDFSTLRVLALQAHPQAGWARAYPDLQLLKRDGRPLIAVVRLDGQLPQLHHAAITAQISSLLRDWQAVGVPLAGLEIDHDCASARLPAYAELLGELRQALPRELALSITALPAWMSSAHLEAVLSQVDSSVLQVHAVSDPHRGLFDAEQAKRWAEQYATRSSKPFLLALPAYGVALLDSSDGMPLVESEAPLRQSGTRRELQADPRQVAALLQQLRANPPSGMRGIIWFRLPLAGDRRAWAMETLLAVVRKQPLQAALGVTRRQNGAVSELQLRNHGNLASALPARIELPADNCEAADGLGAYRVESAAKGLTFIRQRSGQLAAGSERALGWARCARIDQGGMHVVF